MEQENKYTKEEVALHNTKEDCWIIIKDIIYDITDFISIHPGGASILASQGGKDATEFFEELHRPEIIDEVASDYKIGILSDSKVTTIEGLVSNGKMHPMQEAFKKTHGLQCGFCTPGMVMSAIDLLNNKKNPSDKEIRDWLEGNICRCTGYQNIIAAVKEAATKM